MRSSSSFESFGRRTSDAAGFSSAARFSANAFAAASLMCCGVSKSGSPAPKLSTSTPCFFSAFAWLVMDIRHFQAEYAGAALPSVVIEVSAHTVKIGPRGGPPNLVLQVPLLPPPATGVPAGVPVPPA
mgnify:CR=1 FL=1